MRTLIVERDLVDVRGGGTKRAQFAVACPEPNRLTDRYSLTFEAHLTPWTERDMVETWQREIEAIGGGCNDGR